MKEKKKVNENQHGSVAWRSVNGKWRHGKMVA